MDIVTGAFGFIGKYITRHLLDLGEDVRTVTTHPDKPDPFGAAYTSEIDRQFRRPKPEQGRSR